MNLEPFTREQVAGYLASTAPRGFAYCTVCAREFPYDVFLEINMVWVAERLVLCCPRCKTR